MNTRHERDKETEYTYAGARILDHDVVRWLSLDPNSQKYPALSPYNYVAGNPVSFIDPDGKDVYVVVWATQGGHIGHAGIAVDNYQKVSTPVLDVYGNAVKNKFGDIQYKDTYVKDGTVTYYDLWPGVSVGATNASDDVPALFNNIQTTVNDLQNRDVTGSEGYPADGVIKLTTIRSTDKKVVKALNDFKNNTTSYNGTNCNCSDYVEAGVEKVSGTQLNVNESIANIYNSTTPNKLFKESSNLPNATILKNPGNKVNNSFTDGIKQP